MPRLYLLTRHRHHLHFFPALLPLVEIVPMVLAGVGALATAAGALGRRRRLIVICAAAVAVLSVAGIAAAVYIRTPDKAVRYTGTQEITADKYDKVIHYADLSDAARTAPAAMDTFDEVYSVQVKNPILATPAIAAGTLVLGTYKNTAEGFDIATGEALWLIQQREPIFTIGNGAGDTVYVAEGLHHTRAGMMTKLSLPSAKIEWQRQFLGHLESPPALTPAGDQMFFPAGAGGIWSVRTDDGGVVWHADIGHTDATPLLADHTVYAAAQPDEQIAESLFYALDADTGAVKWTSKLQGQPWGCPVLSADKKRIITTTGRGQIGVARDTDAGWAMALSPDDGRILWQRDLSGMAIDPGDYLPSEDLAILTLKTGEIVAIDGRTGDVRWQAKIGTEFMAAAVLVERSGGKSPLVAATTSDGVFTIRDARTGKEIRRRPVLSGASSAPVAQGDRIYVTTPYRIYVYGGIGSL